MNIKPSLATIAKKYHSDKGLEGPTAKWNGNNYVDIYESYFRDRADDPITMLEVGIGVAGPNWTSKIAHGANAGGGASVQMWQDYFPQGKIYAMDINPADHLDTDRIKTFLVDQGSREELAAFNEKTKGIEFDFIIDDGSHRGDHQQITLEALWPRLKSGGLFIIEDLNDRGHGEIETGRHGSREVVSTRRLFLDFVNSGKPIEPNAFDNTGFLSEISDIRFHSPRPVFDFSMLFREFLRVVAGRAAKGVAQTRFAANSYKMVVLKKK